MGFESYIKALGRKLVTLVSNFQDPQFVDGVIPPFQIVGGGQQRGRKGVICEDHMIWSYIIPRVGDDSRKGLS